jgi:hypothetical protein
MSESQKTKPHLDPLPVNLNGKVKLFKKNIKK